MKSHKFMKCTLIIVGVFLFVFIVSNTVLFYVTHEMMPSEAFIAVLTVCVGEGGFCAMVRSSTKKDESEVEEDELDS